MSDPVLRAFLECQLAQGMALARDSDILELFPVDGNPPQRYIASYRARGLIQNDRGEVVEFEKCDIGIWLPDDYLRHVNPAQVLCYLGPAPRPHHPNIRPPFICMHLRPGTPLVDLLYTCFELWTYNLYATHDEGLNHAASQWVRNQPAGRFPVDRRSLKRKPMSVRVEPAGPAEPIAGGASGRRQERR